jgi:hypothetical protein
MRVPTVKIGMKIQWNTLMDLLLANRRAGSTTAAKDAVERYGGLLITHDQKFAIELGGGRVVSQGDERKLREMTGRPILFDNKLLMDMCEQGVRLDDTIKQLEADMDYYYENDAKRESEFSARVQYAVFDAFNAWHWRLDNALYIARLMEFPTLFEKVHPYLLDPKKLRRVG